MAKKKKPKVKLGALGPQPHWLRMSIEQRERTRNYIKNGLLGWERDGVKIPSARRIYRDLKPSDGFNLQHIERWSAAKLARARERIQSLNTLTSRPFTVLIPRSKKQRVAAQKFTGQDLPSQKEMIVQVQDAKHDKAVFRDGQVAVERTMPKGSKVIKQRYLFRDYVAANEVPVSFLEMRNVTKQMLPDMPEKYYGRDVYYTLITVQYGPIGESFLHEDILQGLGEYHLRYGTGDQHKQFAEQIIGFQMVGTFVSAAAYQVERDRNKALRKARKKLIFSRAVGDSRCPHVSKGKRCMLTRGHAGKHKYWK
jgi:hypothetical protein